MLSRLNRPSLYALRSPRRGGASPKATYPSTFAILCWSRFRNSSGAAQTVTKPDGCVVPFEMDPFKKAALLTAPDEIGRTLAHEDAIAAYEQAYVVA